MTPYETPYELTPYAAAQPEREYFVSPRRTRRRRRRGMRLFSLLLSLAVFAGGFALGRASAAELPGARDNAPAEADIAEAPPLLPAAASLEDAAEPPAGDASAVETVPGGGEPEQTPEPQAPASEPGEVWHLRLISRDSPLPEDFTIPELTRLRNGQSVDSRIYPELQAMMDAARAEGLDPLICSSYRTGKLQTKLFERKVGYYQEQGYGREEAEAKASFWVARPGTSEHQTGLALDIVSAGYQVLDEKQEETALQQWLMAHCAEYGFILRYPTDKSDLTGVGYEPWHYRYVGAEAAREITVRGICLEEYLEEG